MPRTEKFIPDLCQHPPAGQVGRLGNPVQTRSNHRCCNHWSVRSGSDPVTGETWEGGAHTQKAQPSQDGSQNTDLSEKNAMIHWMMGFLSA